MFPPFCIEVIGKPNTILKIHMEVRAVNVQKRIAEEEAEMTSSLRCKNEAQISTLFA